ncbi:MAG: NirD/YgiW/YdeI family stress tolerance protein [Desulfovibrionaceae bacterium]|nr:NirD/YgiW/YdeI family stress tolerance protein [Desulfovibrionaceae bacterium]
MRVIPALLLAIALAAPAAPAFADFVPGDHHPEARGHKPGHGGFHSRGAAYVTSAAQVAGAYDDTPCELVGHIINQVSYDRYTFKDKSGTVVVDIDRKKFRGQEVTPRTVVRLLGEVDSNHGRREVDVDYLEIIRR